MERKATNPFYLSRAWRKVRQKRLEMDCYLCQDCLKEWEATGRGTVHPATMVHHIDPLELCPEKALDLDNLISLCDACHNKRHPEKGGAIPETPREIPAGLRVIRIEG